MKMLSNLILVFSSLFVFQTNALNKDIDKIVEVAVQNDHFNGVILVADGEQIIYEKAIGYANGDKSDKLTLAHRFNIGSISKEFPALALNILLQEKKISLQQPLSDFIENLPLWGDKIRIQHLFNYSSGLPDFPWKSGITNDYVFKSLNEIRELSATPGTKYHYSYYNNFLLAIVIEKVTKISFDQYLQSKIFSHLEMYNTENNLNIPKGSLPTAKAFGADGKEDDFPAFVTGPSVYTTVNDLFKWVLSIKNHTMIGSASFNEIVKPFSLETNSDGFAINQSAFGNIKYSGNEAIAIFHDGSHMNFHSMLYFDKLKNRTILILSNNKAKSKIFEIGNNIIELLDKIDSNNRS